MNLCTVAVTMIYMQSSDFNISKTAISKLEFFKYVAIYNMMGGDEHREKRIVSKYAP